MKRVMVFMMVFFCSCFDVTMASNNDQESDSDSIGYSDEEELRIERAIYIIVSRIRRVRAKAFDCLNTLPGSMSLLSSPRRPEDFVVRRRLNRCNGVLNQCRELENELKFSLIQYREFVISSEKLFDDFGAIATVVNMLLLSNL